jgi:hypothetical protein
VADEQQTQVVDGGAGPGVPVFGQRSGTIEQRRYRQFGIEVETDKDRWVESFDAYFDPDAGAILQMMNARTEGQQANATAVLLRTSLRDDDGVPAEWHFPAGPVTDDDGEEVLYYADEDLGELVEWKAPEVAEGEDEPEPPPGVEPRYEWHDGELLTATELRQEIADFDVLRDGSSRRRFEYVMNSPRHRVQLDALTDLAEWITGDVAKRPTRKPTRSGRGQSRTSRTSRGSSRGTR